MVAGASRNVGLGGFDRFLDALTRRVDRLPPLPPPPGADEGLVLTIRHAASGTEAAVAEWQQQVAAGPLAWASDPEGLQVVIHFAAWDDPIIDSENEAPALAPAYHAPDAEPLPHGPPRLTLTVSGRVWICQHCGFEWPFEGSSEHLGPCPRCSALWAWKAAPTHGGGATITW